MQPTNINIKFESQAEVNEYAQKNNKVLVILDDHVLDVTSFAEHHPGGAGFIRNYQTKNIKEQMQFHHPLTLKMADTMTIGSFKRQIQRIIDPSKPLMTQIWNLDHETYLKIVNHPHWMFVPSPRMFEYNFMEPLSHNQWYTILLLPFLFICFLFWRLPSQLYAQANYVKMALVLVLGIFSFSLAEYLLHRFLFHSQRHLFDNRLMRYLHYVLHGIHHMLPSDPDRLVYPPALAIITAAAGFYTVCQVIYFNDKVLNACFWTGFAIGYVIYDLIHYALHHVDTSKNPHGYFHNLQKYHNQHHFGGEQMGFGVSSKFWDIIFRTEFKEKKVKH